MKRKHGHLAALTVLLYVTLALGLAWQVPNGLAQGTPPTTSVKREVLAFTVLGDTYLEQTIKGISVQSASSRSTEIRLTLPILENNEGVILDPKEWFRVSPGSRGTVSKSQPFVFDLTAKVPKHVSREVSNGLYTGVLRLTSPDLERPEEIPVELTLDIPDIKLAGQGQGGKLRMEMQCSLPGKGTTALYIGTTSVNPQKIALYLSPNLADAQGAAVDAKKIRVVLVDANQATIQVPVAQEVRVPLVAQAFLADLRPGPYTGEVYLDGERVRDKAVSLTVMVLKPGATLAERVSHWAWLGVVLGVVGVGWSGRRLVQHRPYFQGREVTYEVDESGTVTGNFRSQFSITGTREGRKMAYRISTDSPTMTLGERTITSTNNLLAQGSIIACEDETGQYELEVSYVDDYTITLSLLRSPYSASRPWLGMGAGLIVLALGLALRGWSAVLLC
jgi:hypothetical protein